MVFMANCAANLFIMWFRLNKNINSAYMYDMSKIATLREAPYPYQFDLWTRTHLHGYAFHWGDPRNEWSNVLGMVWNAKSEAECSSKKLIFLCSSLKQNTRNKFSAEQCTNWCNNKSMIIVFWSKLY